MKAATKTQVTALIDNLQALIENLRALRAQIRDAPAQREIDSAVLVLELYGRNLRRALLVDDKQSALKTANNATSVNKGLSDQGPFLSSRVDLRELGVAVTQQARDVARMLRSDLGMPF